MSFAPVIPARGPMFGATSRAGMKSAGPPVLSEKDLYEHPEGRQVN
jgi:hypothetical protein